ncbi:MAG: L-glutamate gamma-semialdehyde dehydrogenase [Acidimicrobiales bacterium]|jgi:1-pyrroline-5-carboxylate dehydrogenase
MDAITSVPVPYNEPVREYPPGSAQCESLRRRIAELEHERHELALTIGGKRRMAGGERFNVVQPHDRGHVLGESAHATTKDAADAVGAAKAAAPAWRDLPFDERAAIFLRAADLLAGPWRDTLNAATMLGQSKSVQQAEIDSACELIDFWRFNVHFARSILAEQPNSAPGEWDRTDHRPLDGFVTAITPFNFTAISGNLPTAPALMGNTVVWKPASTQLLAARHLMALLEAAGLPPGVINLITGGAAAMSSTVLTDPDFAGLHFTGSTATFKSMWRIIGNNLDHYRAYPRIVGETGGKDFVLAHSSADQDSLVTALVRGAFEYQGQKCSAASRAYLPRSLWDHGLREALVDTTKTVTYGDVTDFSCFGGAVIDAHAFADHKGLFERVRDDKSVEILTGGVADDRDGFFVQPTLLLGDDPRHEIFTTEYFGPILSLFVYADEDYESVLDLIDTTSPYALTGSVFATSRAAIIEAESALRFAAGNFYVNDKPTGAVVGRQPFGGSRGSGTNDKAGSKVNLLRWTSPRSIKETFNPPRHYEYSHMG